MPQYELSTGNSTTINTPNDYLTRVYEYGGISSTSYNSNWTSFDLSPSVQQRLKVLEEKVKKIEEILGTTVDVDVSEYL